MEHEHLPYPSVLPYDDIMGLIRAVRSGTLLTEKATAVKSLWELSGYAALMSVGEPGDSPERPNVPIHSSMAPIEDDEQILVALETYANTQHQDSPNVAQALNIPWAAVLKWALKLLDAAL